MEDGVDTLGRWMAHHLAELMVRAKKAKNPNERAASKDKAVETIVRIWEHRASSDRINPLSNLIPVVKVLRTIAEESPPWAYLPADGRGSAARRVYDLLRRLIIYISLLELHDVEAARRRLRRARRIAGQQSEAEREAVAHLLIWLDTLPMPRKTPQRTSRRAAKDAGQKAIEGYAKAAREIIDEIGATLPGLKEELDRRDQ